MLSIADFLSRISGAYIISVPLLVVLYTAKYQLKQNSIILKTLGSASIITFFIAYLFIYLDEISLFYLIGIWIILIPVSTVILLLINSETNLANIDLKLLISSIPRKVTIWTMVLMIAACSLIAIDTVANRPFVLALHQSLMQEISEASDPKTILMNQPVNIYGSLDIAQNIKQIEEGQPSVVYSFPWKMVVEVHTSTQTENVLWRFQYIRFFGKWQFQGSTYKSVESKAQ